MELLNDLNLALNTLGVSWCCGNYCLLAFVLWCGYCSVSFQSFVLRHWCPQHQETTNTFLTNVWATGVKRNKTLCERIFGRGRTTGMIL